MGNLGSSEIMLIGVFLLIFLIPAIFFLLTQQNTLKAIQPQNRTMSPGEVWLQLIPLFNIVWQFVVVSRISESLRRELNSENRFSFEGSDTPHYMSNEKPTYQIGTAFCILNCCGIIPVLGTIARIAGIICWIVYWIKLAEYKNQVSNRTYNAPKVEQSVL